VASATAGLAPTAPAGHIRICQSELPNEDLGEEVKAVVQLAGPAAASPKLAAELITYCRDRLTHFKCPQTIDLVPDLPRSPTGKLYKRLRRDAYWAGHQTSIV
jgi:acyl-coenzyme A synthetase/AMP-(fatty) acid ligase